MGFSIYFLILSLYSIITDKTGVMSAMNTWFPTVFNNGFLGLLYFLSLKPTSAVNRKASFRYRLHLFSEQYLGRAVIVDGFLLNSKTAW